MAWTDKEWEVVRNIETSVNSLTQTMNNLPCKEHRVDISELKKWKITKDAVNGYANDHKKKQLTSTHFWLALVVAAAGVAVAILKG